jgi:glutamyl-Q tRNA(Asp) synthetase
MQTLEKAWQALGFEALGADSVSSFWQTATERWAARFGLQGLQVSI